MGRVKDARAGLVSPETKTEKQRMMLRKTKASRPDSAGRWLAGQVKDDGADYGYGSRVVL